MLPEKNLRTNLLETPDGKIEALSSARQTMVTPRTQGLNKFRSKLTSAMVTKIADELVQREIYLPPTKWNKTKLIFANFYEIFLIILGLALSIYQDDASSFVFQILMQIVLFYSQRDMGKHVKTQRKICIGTLVVIIAIMISKWIYMVQTAPILQDILPDMEQNLLVLGYDFKLAADGITKIFDVWSSLEFETYASILCILLIRYYNQQLMNDARAEPYHYVHHSEWLNMHKTLYLAFFVFLTVDTFFAQTIIQMLVLAIMMMIMFLWANEYSKKEVFTKQAVTWCIRMYTFQLSVMAFSQIAPIKTYISLHSTVYQLMYVTGLILNENIAFNAVTHIFLMCFVLGFGSQFETCILNYQEYKKHEKDFADPQLTETLLRKKSIENKKGRSSLRKNEPQGDTEAPALKKQKFGRILNFHSQITTFNYQKFVATYMPYVCIWMIRIISIVYSYAYHGYPAFIILTWVLLSFVTPALPFVNCTTYIYLPIFTLAFFCTYTLNIDGIFELTPDGKYYSDPIINNLGRHFQFAALEVCGMTLNIIFLILLMGSRNDLRLQRDEFRVGIFEKLTDKKSVFLWQLSFYVLKRIHVVLLSLIFIFGMKEFNIYYIGLLYFFVVYTSSLVTYRKSGRILVVYAAFFIWIQYFWSLVQNQFDSQGFLYKIFMMITIQKYEEPKDNGVGQINQYLEYAMPIGQWTILMLQVFMSAVNKFFMPGKTYKAKSLENPAVKVEYANMGEYYEDKCDYVLRKKFPSFAKVLIRLRMIFSEMMIIGILITQGFILVLQPPNLMFWGFLIFSLTLQTAVVSASEQNPKMLRRCASQSKILKIYSGFVLVAQIAYHFINDKSFLAQYGFDEYLNYILGDLNEYMTIIGFENYQNSTRSIFEIFVSQILFYITACILEDYFTEKLEKIEQQQAQEYDMFNNDDNFVRDKTTVMQSQVKGFIVEEDEDEVQNEKERILFDFEKIRFSIPYMIYQKMENWRIMDSIAMNFHLVTAAFTIFLCANWQISLFMAFYLLCNVMLCMRAARELHVNGQRMKQKNHDWIDLGEKDSGRNNIEEASENNINSQQEIDVDTAHKINKGYMHHASKILLAVRTSQWTYQYWLLIISMIIMYPTPIISQLKDKMTPDQQVLTDKSIFWLFWSGVYVPSDSVNNLGSHAPLYALLILLIFEKQSQRWQENRYGCSLKKVTEFKTIEEQLRLIKNDKDHAAINKESIIPVPKPLSEFITIMEAKQECDRVESLYREQTEEIREKRLKEIIELGIKRKYVVKFRNAMKIVMEQISLQLLLFSCANKSNIVSVLYLGLLLTFLLIKNKTTGMLYMSYTFGIILALEYICSLTNFTSLNNPAQFPAPYNEGYPSRENPTGDFIFPWFLKIDFLRENLHWAHFFSIDIMSAQVNDIWFDFANLVILTIYFFNFGNPINAKNVKVSFSQTKSLETALYDYSRIQITKKYYLKHPKKAEDGKDIDFDLSDKEEDSHQSKHAGEEDQFSEKAADNSLEYFLGATHYLNELKQSIFLYYFTKKSRYFSFIGLQIVTLVMTLMLAILCRSVMSLGYMIACIPLILQITDFFNLDKLHQEGRRWNHPYYICGPLMIFSFVDIALQIFCQAPFYSGNYFQRQLGFDKVYIVNESVTFMDLLYPSGNSTDQSFVSLAEGGQSLMFLVLKSINLFFIFLQSRIYESDSFWQFIRVDLRRLLKLAQSYKRMAMTYRYNNWKLQKIVTVQQRKQKMYEGVAELKVKMAHFMRVQNSLISGQPMPQRQNLRQPLLQQIDEEEQKHEVQNLNREDSTDQKKQKRNSKYLSERKKTISNLIDKKFDFQQFQDLLKQDDLYFEKQEAFKKIKPKIGRCGTYYLKLHKKDINQIVFINDIEEAQVIKEMTSQGKRNIECDLERVMMQDIDKFFLLKKNNTIEKKVRRKIGIKLEEDEIEFKDMEKTQEFLRCSNIFFGVVGAILQATFSKLSTIAYIFMIVSQVLNAGIISIALPFAVFGYALMEECRPGQWFWKVIKIYVLVILFLKFVINLDFLYDDKNLVATYTDISNWLIIGLWRVEGIWNLFIYILPEIIILTTIMGQTYYETLLGLYDKRETDFENIEQAKERFLKQFNDEKTEEEEMVTQKNVKKHLVEDEDEQENEVQGLTYDERIINYKIELSEIREKVLKRVRKEHDDVVNDNATLQRNRKEMADEIEKELTFERKFSLIVDRAERRQVIKQLKAKRPENQGIIKNYFSKQGYFKRLFPKVKEQKPGIDLYGKITFVQFVICIYLISYYTKLDARGTQNLENSSQFSIYMVLMLFIQVFVMILERYISRTNTRVNLQKARGGKKDDLDDKMMSKLTLGDHPRSLSMHLQAQKTGDTILFGNVNNVKAISQSKEILSIELQHTRMTNQQVLKWIIQWILLILYHFLVFWIFPLSSNDAIYGTPYCDTQSTQYEKYGCPSFRQNWYLLIFYVIFCYYFMLSSLQIRYGYPDYKEPSSLTSQDGLGNVLLYRIFHALPFIYELKTILDWCFQKTSLDIFQWLELGEIDAELYFFKNGNKGYFERKIGTRILRFEKCLCGCFCLGVILFFLVGPFFMFSNLSVIADENLVTDAAIDFKIKMYNAAVHETYEFPIFETDKPLSLRPIAEQEFMQRGYDQLPETKFFQPDQVQKIRMFNSSDTEWGVSGDYKNIFKNLLSKAAHGQTDIKTELLFSFQFTRPGPVEAPTSKGVHNKVLNLNDPSDMQILKELHQAMNIDCSANPNAVRNVQINDFIPYQLRLGEQKTVLELPLNNKNVTLTYSCQNYWAFNVNLEGIMFITFSDLISSNLFNATSIMGFYLGVAFIVGTTLRKIVVYNADRIYITEIPNPDPLRNLIKAIFMQRLEQNLKREEELFFILMEMLRSPEMIKAICGSSLRAPLLQHKDDQPSSANLRA